MKTTELIQNLLEHPEAETLLSRLEDRLAAECATPNISGVFSAYLRGDALEMFQAFTGWSMEHFLVITGVTPDHGNPAAIQNTPFQEDVLTCSREVV